MSMLLPGSPSPMMAVLAAGDPLDDLVKAFCALRFRRSASARIERTFVAPTNNLLWSIYLEFQLTVPGECGFFGSSGTTLIAQFTATRQLEIRIAGTQYWLSNQTFGDFAQFGALQINYDAANATQANRIVVGLNGVAVPGTCTLPLNQATAWNANGGVGRIGANYGGWWADSRDYADCLISRVVHLDGQAPAFTTYGQLHPLTKQWRGKSRSALKSLADGVGNNNFFLPFDDPTNTTTLCADASTHGNNFTATNISLTAGVTKDSLISTPTDCFAVMNPLEYIGTPVLGIFSNGNLRVADAGNGSYNSGGNSTIRVDGGKGPWKFEAVPTGSNVTIGVTDVSYGSCRFNGVGYYGATGQVFVNGSVVATVATFTTADVVGVEFTDTSVIFKKNSTTVHTQAYTAANPKAIAASVWIANTTGAYADCNFGQQPYQTTTFSGSAKSISTKNLPKPTITNNKIAFVKVTGLGSAIEAALLAEQNANGWASDVRLDFFKKRSGSYEGARLRFSDDAGNYIDMSGTAAKTAWATLTAGDSYAAWSFRFNAGNGFATGTVAHTNGAANTITDNLARSRKVIFLRRESAGGGATFMYHPDLTAGKLLYLNTTAGETTDVSINTVLSSSFVVDASLPTGTYRWWTLGETAGLLDLFKYFGNSSANGTCIPVTGLPGFFETKSKSVGGTDYDHQIYDSARNPNNVGGLAVDANNTDVENSTGVYDLDFVAGGIKLRNTYAVINASGVEYVGININDFPLRYSNAR